MSVKLETANPVRSFKGRGTELVASLLAGSGAMATGVGHVLKALAPGVEVICVQPLGAPAMTLSWRERRVVTTESTDTIADGLDAYHRWVGVV